MKNVRQDFDDSLRPEYRRSDFGEMVQGKYATTQLEFAEFVRLLFACIGEDEGFREFIANRSTQNINVVWRKWKDSAERNLIPCTPRSRR